MHCNYHLMGLCHDDSTTNTVQQWTRDYWSREMSCNNALRSIFRTIFFFSFFSFFSFRLHYTHTHTIPFPLLRVGMICSACARSVRSFRSVRTYRRHFCFAHWQSVSVVWYNWPWRYIIYLMEKWFVLVELDKRSQCIVFIHYSLVVFITYSVSSPRSLQRFTFHFIYYLFIMIVTVVRDMHIFLFLLLSAMCRDVYRVCARPFKSNWNSFFCFSFEWIKKQEKNAFFSSSTFALQVKEVNNMCRVQAGCFAFGSRASILAFRDAGVCWSAFGAFIYLLHIAADVRSHSFDSFVISQLVLRY